MPRRHPSPPTAAAFTPVDAPREAALQGLLDDWAFWNERYHEPPREDHSGFGFRVRTPKEKQAYCLGRLEELEFQIARLCQEETG